MPKSRRLSLLLLFAFCSVVAFSQVSELDTPPAIEPEPLTEQQQSAEQSNNPQQIDPATLASALRSLSGKLRSEAAGWREDSEELLKRVGELHLSLSKAEAERTSLSESLKKSTASQESLKQAHAQEIAAIRAALEAEISRIEKARDQARRSAQLWKAAAFITAGAGAGFAIGGPTGAAIGATGGIFVFIIL
jgi:chromosome segregation ATPase